MVPHSAALLTVAAYLYKGGTGSRFKVELTRYRAGKYTVESAGGDRWKTSSDYSSWSCTATMELRGNKVTIRNHDHKERTSISEEATFSGLTFQGTVRESTKGYNGSFSGELKAEDGSKLYINGTKGVYETQLSR